MTGAVSDGIVRHLKQTTATPPMVHASRKTNMNRRHNPATLVIDPDYDRLIEQASPALWRYMRHKPMLSVKIVNHV